MISWWLFGRGRHPCENRTVRRISQLEKVPLPWYECLFVRLEVSTGKRLCCVRSIRDKLCHARVKFRSAFSSCSIRWLACKTGFNQTLLAVVYSRSFLIDYIASYVLNTLAASFAQSSMLGIGNVLRKWSECQIINAIFIGDKLCFWWRNLEFCNDSV